MDGLKGEKWNIINGLSVDNSTGNIVYENGLGSQMPTSPPNFYAGMTGFDVA